LEGKLQLSTTFDSDSPEFDENLIAVQAKITLVSGVLPLLRIVFLK
jgi:hypothetical protein